MIHINIKSYFFLYKNFSSAVVVIGILKPNKKNMCVFGQVGQAHVFWGGFWKKNFFMHFQIGISPFKMHKNIFFPENLKKNLGFASKLR